MYLLLVLDKLFCLLFVLFPFLRWVPCPTLSWIARIYKLSKTHMYSSKKAKQHPHSWHRILKALVSRLQSLPDPWLTRTVLSLLFGGDSLGCDTGTALTLLGCKCHAVACLGTHKKGPGSKSFNCQLNQTWPHAAVDNKSKSDCLLRCFFSLWQYRCLNFKFIIIILSK